MASTLLFGICAVLAVFSGAQGTYDPDTQNVYHLFTRQNPTVSQPMLLGFPTLIGSNFNSTRRTGIVIHGWNAGPTSPSNLAIIPAGLAGLDVNIIAVDWSAGAVEDDYNDVISVNLPKCADSIARFITWLRLQTGQTLDQYHIVGFEIAAHMAGMIGRQLNGEVSLISILNPPRHGFNSTNQFRPTDGVVTEAIHTDIFGTGMMEAVAKLDFYPNGGLLQPGCDTLDWKCSQDRSYEYYAESLAVGGFTSTLCESTVDAVTGNCNSNETVPMGGLTDRTGLTGTYFLMTNAVSPFSTG